MDYIGPRAGPRSAHQQSAASRVYPTCTGPRACPRSTHQQSAASRVYPTCGVRPGNDRVGMRDKDVLRFAPNFTVYVLPPNAVCLYSEDRKFFLHRNLYCALAERIDNDVKSA